MNREITLDEQIACVQRELAYRRRCYPKWVADKRMTQAKADQEIAAMIAVMNNLIDLKTAGVVSSVEQVPA